MLVREIYRYNKALLWAFVLFISAFIILNIKGGFIVTPIYMYGMYTGTHTLHAPADAYFISVNGKPLAFKNYDLTTRDILTSSVDQYIKSEQNNTALVPSVKKIFSRLGLATLIREENFEHKATIVEFSMWYKNLVEEIMGKKVNVLQIQKQSYIWDGTVFTFLAPPKTILQLGNTNKTP